jgi:hypothetical protein
MGPESWNCAAAASARELPEMVAGLVMTRGHIGRGEAGVNPRAACGPGHCRRLTILNRG